MNERAKAFQERIRRYLSYYHGVRNTEIYVERNLQKGRLPTNLGIQEPIKILYVHRHSRLYQIYISWLTFDFVKFNVFDIFYIFDPFFFLLLFR